MQLHIFSRGHDSDMDFIFTNFDVAILMKMEMVKVQSNVRERNYGTMLMKMKMSKEENHVRPAMLNVLHEFSVYTM